LKRCPHTFVYICLSLLFFYLLFSPVLFFPLSAPCPPDAVSAVVDCATNVVTVTWDNSVAEVLYTVTAECPSGQHYTCNVTGMGCDLSTLSCGTEYNVTVTPSHVTPSHGGCVGVNTPSQLVKTGRDQSIN
jgi:hypothetical protein